MSIHAAAIAVLLLVGCVASEKAKVSHHVRLVYNLWSEVHDREASVRSALADAYGVPSVVNSRVTVLLIGNATYQEWSDPQSIAILRLNVKLVDLTRRDGASGGEREGKDDARRFIREDRKRVFISAGRSAHKSCEFTNIVLTYQEPRVVRRHEGKVLRNMKG